MECRSSRWRTASTCPVRRSTGGSGGTRTMVSPGTNPESLLASAEVEPARLPVVGACEHMFVSSEGTILHADVDSFYASVEQRDDPRLRCRPVIVGAGVVLAASYEAKAYGVRTPMSGGPSRPPCPPPIVGPPRVGAFGEAGKGLFEGV